MDRSYIVDHQTALLMLHRVGICMFPSFIISVLKAIRYLCAVYTKDFISDAFLLFCSCFHYDKYAVEIF